MKIVLAPDKFKGSLTARHVCEAMTEGINLADPDATVVALPMADGGEGTAEVLTQATGGRWSILVVEDPLGRAIQAGYGLSADGRTAFLEMAQASGLRLLEPAEYNPLLANTFGTGQLLLEAVKQGANHLVLGIGGSATNDAGTGMASALGWRFVDQQGELLRPCGSNLSLIHKILPPDQPIQVSVDVACDVTNPLFGPNGAAYVYGPQKGAGPAEVELLDRGLRHLADLIRDQFGVELAEIPGAGAAGGLGAGALFFLRAQLKEGVRLVMEQTRFADQIREADLVLTGEGKIDRQTLQGKLIHGIATQCQAAGVPVVALCGTLEADSGEIASLGLTAAFSILSRPQSLEEALAEASRALSRTTFQVVRLFMRSE